jgi:hypothetical protein
MCAIFVPKLVERHCRTPKKDGAFAPPFELCGLFFRSLFLFRPFDQPLPLGFGNAQGLEFRDALAGLDGHGIGRGALARDIARIEPVQGINAVGVDFGGELLVCTFPALSGDRRVIVVRVFPDSTTPRVVVRRGGISTGPSQRVHCAFSTIPPPSLCDWLLGGGRIVRIPR